MTKTEKADLIENKCPQCGGTGVVLSEQLQLYTAIGRFMFEFSQLEFIIRFALGEALALREIDDDACIHNECMHRTQQ
jgi:hypothetical protein